jgi:hypothetical protein
MDTRGLTPTQKLLWKRFGFSENTQAAQPVSTLAVRSPFLQIALESTPSPKKQRIAPVDALRIPLGKDANGEQIDWIPCLETNGFFVAFGASGSGKTESLKAIAAEIDNYGIPTLIIDFHGDIETDRAESIILSHAPALPYGINPLELDSLDPSDGGVYPQLLKLSESLSAFNGSVGYKQKLTIDKYLKLTYEVAGITDKNPSSWLKKPPTLADTIRLMESDCFDTDIPAPARNDISSALGVVRSVFEHPVFSKPKKLDIHNLLSNSYRINVKPLTPEVQFIVVDTILRKVAAALMAKGSIPVNCSDRERYRLAVIMDEANRFTSKTSNRQGILDIFALEMRKFGAIMGLGSQRMQHFSEETLAQIAVMIALKLQSKEDAKFPANEFGLTVDDLISLHGKGHGFVKFGNDKAIEFQFASLQSRNLPKKIKAIASSAIEVHSEPVDDSQEVFLIGILSGLSQQKGWLTASTVKQFNRQFKDVSPDQIRQMFIYMAQKGIGETQKSGTSLEWKV